MNITDEQLIALYARHCECRPLRMDRKTYGHSHDCDTGITDDVELALYSSSEEALAARSRCGVYLKETRRSSQTYAASSGYKLVQFQSFMDSPVVASLFGLKKEDVFEVLVRELQDGETSPYWAWWDNAKKCFPPPMIWGHKSLVEMCFPYGSQVEADKGRGEMCNVVVERVSVP